MPERPLGFAALALAACLAAPLRAAPVTGTLPQAEDEAPAAPGDSASEERDSAAQAANDAPSAEPPPPLWLEAYGEGVYSKQEDDNLAGFSDWKVGKRLPGPLKADVYAKIRLYRDRRDFYWNNRADGGLGARLPIFEKLSLTAFAEATWGHYLSLSAGAVPMERLQGRIDRTRESIDAAQKQFQAMYKAIFDANIIADPDSDRAVLGRLETLGDAQRKALNGLNARLDSLETAKDSLRQAMDSIALIPSGEVVEYKIGLVFWRAWGGPPDDADPPTAWFGFPLRPWGEVYGDCIASTLTRHVRARQASGEYADSAEHIRNVILYANPAAGWLVMEGKAGSIAAFGTAYAWVDVHGDWWNNRAMAGPGLRWQPFRELDLMVKAEYLWGSFFGRERKEDPNPYAQRFTDTRLTASFWHGLGI